MKYCPKCHADVEGLLYTCDCCGASLDVQHHLFFMGVYDTPACLNFSQIAFSVLREMEPGEQEECYGIADCISFYLYCYQDISGKLKNRVTYRPNSKQASITLVLNTDDIVYADDKGKARIAAFAFSEGLEMLNVRMSKYKKNIDCLIEHTKPILQKYAR